MSSNLNEFSTIAQTIVLNEDRFVQKAMLGGIQMNEIEVSKIKSAAYSPGFPLFVRPSIKFELIDGTSVRWFILGWLPKLTGQYSEQTEILQRMNEIIHRQLEGQKA